MSQLEPPVPTPHDALVALLTDGVFIAMPPMPFGYEGRDVVIRFCAGLFAAGRR
jgi:RNA polymerase sigma-70 factor (ECF subfamily)